MPPIPYAAEDHRRLLESNHDVRALLDPNALTDQDVWRQAATQSRDELAQATQTLRSAARAKTSETTETTAARAEALRHKGVAIAQYTWVRTQISARWLAIDPNDATIAPSTFANRDKQVQRILPAPPSVLQNLSPSSLAETLKNYGEGMADDTEGLATLDLHDRLLNAAATLEEVAQRGTSERNEDKLATQALQAARDAFDRAHDAHKEQISSILTRFDRGAELGRFIRAEDPAYKARRSSGVPITEEDGAGEVDTPPVVPDDGGEVDEG